MKGVWLPVQAVSGYPKWDNAADAEASAAAQAMMYAERKLDHAIFMHSHVNSPQVGSLWSY
jgi:hypothetical protein